MQVSLQGAALGCRPRVLLRDVYGRELWSLGAGAARGFCCVRFKAQAWVPPQGAAVHGCVLVRLQGAAAGCFCRLQISSAQWVYAG